MAVIDAPSGDRTDIVNTVAGASNGDTINIPAGTWTWTSQYNLTKAVTLRGAGIGQTILKDGMGTSSSSMLLIDLVSNQNTFIRDIEFQNDNRSPGAVIGVIHVRGAENDAAVDNRRIIIDRCKFDHLRGTNIRINACYGVLSNNIALLYQQTFFFYMYTSPGSGIYNFTDARWVEANNYGGENFLFCEDNVITHDVGKNYFANDAYGGARYVFRYNTVTRATIEVHGTESSTRNRGGRTFEVYENDLDGGGPGGGEYFDLRSGSALVYNNRGTGYPGTPKPISMKSQRLLDSYNPWGSADGINIWDDNTPGNPIETHAATGVGTRTVTVAGAGWDPDEWRGFVIRKTTPPSNVPITGIDVGTNRITVVGHGFAVNDTVHIQNHSGSTPTLMGAFRVREVVDADTITLKSTAFETEINITVAGTGGYMYTAGSARCSSSAITTNTSDTITFKTADAGTAQDMQFAIGDTFQINRITAIFDQPGRSGGTSLGGVALPTPPASNDQSNDPVYIWGNTYNGAPISTTTIAAEYSLNIVEGTHFFNSALGGYTPYTYPHPLVPTEDPPDPPTPPASSGTTSRSRFRS